MTQHHLLQTYHNPFFRLVSLIQEQAVRLSCAKIVWHFPVSNSSDTIARLVSGAARAQSDLVSLSSHCNSILTSIRSSLLLVHVQLVIYGVDGALETEEAVVQEPLSTYIGVYLVPGGGEIPASFIIYEVNKGNTRGVAAAFNNAVRDGYAQELINLLQEAIPLPGGAESFAAVANSMIVQSSCAQVTPLIRELYPSIYSSARSLGVSASELRRIPVDFPQLAACAHSL